MKNKIHQELVQLATAILQNNTLTISEVKDRAQQLYELSSVLAYAEKNENLFGVTEKETPNFKHSEVEVSISQVEENISEKPLYSSAEKNQISNKKELGEVNNTEGDVIQEAPALLHELENLTQDFSLPDFEPLNLAAEDNTLITEEAHSKDEDQKPVSLNDTLNLNKGLNVGLNDRLAFTNQLFGGSQEDYTRVISQLNTTETLAEAQQFINDIVKPEYNYWKGKETFELRFFELIERNFQL